MLHHDSVPAYVSLLIRNYLAKHQTSVVPHPHCSPDLPPADFFLFPKLKATLKGHRFLNHRGDSGKFDENYIPSQKACSRKHSNNGRNVGMEETLGTVYHQ
jgi:hypothetical protein